MGDGPLHCISLADVYLLLKSSDFVHHGLEVKTAYEGCEDEEGGEPRIELVLKKHEEMNPAQEVRCFVRDDILLGEYSGTAHSRHLTEGYELLRPSSRA